MAGTTPLPLKVSAKVVTAETVVPVLAGDPFVRDANATDAKLEKGIHVHWALPDRLTNGKLITDQGDNVAIFPGVPDLWLVIRFNPCLATPPGSPVQPRPWRAWIVDSVAGTATDYSTWTPPSGREPKQIHTMAGMLPVANSLGYAGYGIWNKSQQQFDPAVAAYYPACRRRFGFYDKGDDIPKLANAKVTYAVVGWYSEKSWDPLYSSPLRGAKLAEWKLSPHIRASRFVEATVSAPLMSSAPTGAPAWLPKEARINKQATPSAAKLQDVAKAAMRGGAPQSRVSAVNNMETSFPKSPAGNGMPVVAKVDYLQPQAGPGEIICHGAVVEVPVSGASAQPDALSNDDVHVYPSLKRALAEIINANGTDEQQTDFIEMLLQDVDAQKSSLAGVLDMPGALHGLSFQGIPGKSRWYACIDVYPKPSLFDASYFALGGVPFVSSRQASGYWPAMQSRSASSRLPSAWQAAVNQIPSGFRKDIPDGTPTNEQIGQWAQDITTAFGTAKTAAGAAGKGLDERLVYIRDARKNAQSLELGRTADKSGTHGAGWWLDLGNPDALPEFLKSVTGAVLYMPHDKNLLEVPGGRWFRPWSPQLVLTNAGRSYKFGNDGAWQSDGFVKARAGGETVYALSVGTSQQVLAKDLMANANSLFARPGIPSDARLLVQETMMLDSENSEMMAFLASTGSTAPQNRAVLQNQFRAAVRGLILSRDPKIAKNAADKLDAIGLFGEMLDYNACRYWEDPRDPIFVDADYTYIESPLATSWQLNQDQVEFVRANGAPPPTLVLPLTERSKVTPSIPNILNGTLVNRKALNFKGDLIQAQTPPDGIADDTFLKMDLISAPLAKLDQQLLQNSRRERSGAVRVNRFELIDMFGTLARPAWNSGVDRTSGAMPAGQPFRSELTPRLPYWSRLQFRLQSAATPTQEATPVDGPICGVLVPDFIEHALEVFDGGGKPLGQLTTDRPRTGDAQGGTLQVTWTLHPWVVAELNVPANDLNAITNSKLRALITSLTQQSAAVGPDNTKWYETGLSAMLRVIDTVRGTLDPSVKTPDRKVRLLGEPILVMPARLELQATAVTNPSDLAKTEPAPMVTPPSLPNVKVRVGDVTRPDDGVLGCFLEDQLKFAPVSTLARDHAILNGLAWGMPSFGKDGIPADHPFIANQPAEFTLTPNKSQDLVVLTDIRGGLYATAGVLPRKKITMPREFIDAAARNLEPTFSIGPILTTQRLGTVKPFVPPPQLEGYSAEYVYHKEDPQTHAESYPDTDVTPVPPLGELPEDRAVLSAGWIRVFKAKA